MARKVYKYDPNTLRYEIVKRSWAQILLRVLGFVATAIVFSSVIIYFAYSFLDSPKEKQLKREINELSIRYEAINRRLDLLNYVMADIRERDNNIYRVIFEAEPITEEQRLAYVNKVQRDKTLDGMDNKVLLQEIDEKMGAISSQLYAQSKSFDEVFERVKNKAQMMASIPAIQPVSNKDLKRIASGFGYRVHPIYKTVKLHEGLDFTAPIGTPVYSTGNGTIEMPNRLGSGYGFHLIVDHGYGYKTLYAHMSRFAVRPGQKVTRGQVIGYVGNTGTSTGPHLHYEVMRNTSKVNPVNFFHNDLSPADYERMRQLAAQANQSFD